MNLRRFLSALLIVLVLSTSLTGCRYLHLVNKVLEFISEVTAEKPEDTLVRVADGSYYSGSAAAYKPTEKELIYDQDGVRLYAIYQLNQKYSEMKFIACLENDTESELHIQMNGLNPESSEYFAADYRLTSVSSGSSKSSAFTFGPFKTTLTTENDPLKVQYLFHIYDEDYNNLATIATVPDCVEEPQIVPIDNGIGNRTSLTISEAGPTTPNTRMQESLKGSMDEYTDYMVDENLLYDQNGIQMYTSYTYNADKNKITFHTLILNDSKDTILVQPSVCLAPDHPSAEPSRHEIDQIAAGCYAVDTIVFDGDCFYDADAVEVPYLWEIYEKGNERHSFAYFYAKLAN